jgi:hypothetical protein
MPTWEQRKGAGLATAADTAACVARQREQAAPGRRSHPARIACPVVQPPGLCRARKKPTQLRFEQERLGDNDAGNGQLAMSNGQGGTHHFLPTSAIVPNAYDAATTRRESRDEALRREADMDSTDRTLTHRRLLEARLQRKGAAWGTLARKEQACPILR